MEGRTRTVKGVIMEEREGAWIAQDTIMGENVTIMPGAVVGRPPVSTKAQAMTGDEKPLPPVKLGDNCVIGSNAVVYRDVTFGDNCLVGDGAAIREGVRIGNKCIVAMGVTINYDTTIGDRVKIMDNTHITGNMVIEDGVFIGMLVSSANDNSIGREAATNVPKEQRVRKGPTVRRFATIGHGSCLNPAIEIGENAIVGANSVVTRDVAPRTVVMGCPAKKVRDLKPEEIVQG